MYIVVLCMHCILIGSHRKAVQFSVVNALLSFSFVCFFSVRARKIRTNISRTEDANVTNYGVIDWGSLAVNETRRYRRHNERQQRATVASCFFFVSLSNSVPVVPFFLLLSRFHFNCSATRIPDYGEHAVFCRFSQSQSIILGAICSNLLELNTKTV